MTIQSQPSEPWTRNSSVYHSRGNFSSGGQEITGKENKASVFFGILSKESNFCLREAQRKTFIPKTKAYKLLNIQVFFLLDEKTVGLEEEQKSNQDIVSLNTSFHGYAHRFAFKLHIWLRYVISNIPDVILIGRMDDDSFVCAPQMFHRLNEVKDELLYYGYPTGSLASCPSRECVDEMFLIIGVELAKRVAQRHFCYEKNEELCLTDGTTEHEFRPDFFIS